MKKHEKNGFTLIELLAVIVILVIIALIAIPVILGVIDKAKKGAFKDSVLNAYNALEYKMAELKISKVPSKEEGGLEISQLPIKSDFIGGMFFSENGKIYAEKVRNKEFCAYGPIDNLTIDKTSNCDSADATPPDIVNEGAVSVSSTSNSVTVNISEGFALDKDSRIAKYEITITGPNNYKETKTLNEEIGSVTFEKLINNTQYCVNVAAFNPSGQSKELSGCKTITTKLIEVPTYKVTPESGWAISKTVEITYPDTSDDYVNEYSLDGTDTWHEYTEPVVLTDFGATSISITARVRDKNNPDNYVSASDLTVPEIYLTSADKVSFEPVEGWELEENTVQAALDWLRSN